MQKHNADGIERSSYIILRVSQLIFEDIILKNVGLILIGIAVAVLVAANLLVSYLEEPEEFRPAKNRDNTTFRSTRHGEVVGFIDQHGARSWQGIPFASPPTGVFRWRAPRPPQTSSVLLEALEPGSPCPQLSVGSKDSNADHATRIIGDEDCLFLNVWSPPNAINLPVMLWLHGGGNTIGNGGSYSGAWLAANREVVVITMNYRLGLFGWFKHPDLATGNLKNDSGNFGTLDIIQALTWLKGNIGEFGGDPGNITIFGESAGGSNVLTMLASPLAKGLFHKAIVQSGGLNLETTARAENYIEQGGHPFSGREVVSKLLISDGLAEDRASAKTHQNLLSRSELRDYLMNKNPAEFFRLLNGGLLGMTSLPDNIRDGYVIPDLVPMELFSSAETHNSVPIILGTNRDEPTFFMVGDPEYIDTYLGLFRRIKNETIYKQNTKYGGLSWKARGVDSIANQLTLSGNNAVFAYRFDWDEEPSQYGFDLSTALGASHALEIPFVFGDFKGRAFTELYPNDTAQMDLSKTITSYWTEFAYRGTPGTGRNAENVNWTPWKEGGLTSIILDSTNDLGVRMSSKEVSALTIKKEFLSDSFEDDRQKCALYRSTFRRDHFVTEEYENLTTQNCDQILAP